jgi:hypothetical protein
MQEVAGDEVSRKRQDADEQDSAGHLLCVKLRGSHRLALQALQFDLVHSFWPQHHNLRTSIKAVTEIDILTRGTPTQTPG